MSAHKNLNLKNPIGTDDQCRLEQMARRVFSAPSVRAARERARAQLLADPTAQSVDGAAGLDRALDQWVMGAVLAHINSDPSRPVLFWGIDNTPRHWFGGVYPGAAVAIDNPDNINRTGPVDGRWRYKIHGRFAPHASAQTSFTVTTAEDGLLTLGKPVLTAALTNLMIEHNSEGYFTLTMDTSPAAGRSNHLQIQSGLQQLAVRDSLSDWSQTPSSLVVEVVDGPALLKPADEQQLTAQCADTVEGFVAHWLTFKRGFWDTPPVNTLVGPIGRDGGWGFQAGGRFELKDDEALVITTRSGGAAYSGFQISDPWMILPNPLYMSTSRNLNQLSPNSDGSFTYVLSLIDPGVANWINTAGLHEGWVMLRWQNVPDGVSAESLLEDCQLIKLSSLNEVLDETVPRCTLTQRHTEIALRAPLYQRRHQENP